MIYFESIEYNESPHKTVRFLSHYYISLPTAWITMASLHPMIFADIILSSSLWPITEIAGDFIYMFCFHFILCTVITIAEKIIDLIWFDSPHKTVGNVNYNILFKVLNIT